MKLTRTVSTLGATFGAAIGPFLALALPAAAQMPVCGSSAGPDIVCTELLGPFNVVATPPYDAISIGTVACNVGTAEAEWFGYNTRHPVIGQALYRLRIEPSGASRFEQVGRSWVKHGQFALDQPGCCQDCALTDSVHLGVGCSDVYSAGLNGGQNILGPRYEVNAFTGAISFPPANQVPWSGTTVRRVEIALTDIETTDFQRLWYVGEGQYVAADDSAAGHGENNVSHRIMSAFRIGSEWNFGFSGPTRIAEPAIRAWSRIDPLVREVEVRVPDEGLCILAWKATELPGGLWDYEYALYNMTSDDALRSFSVPMARGAQVGAIGFKDHDYRGGDGPGNVDFDGTDWPALRSGTHLTWETGRFADAPAANALRWGSVMNFRFQADGGPVAGEITLGTFKSDRSFTVTAQVPGPPGTATGLAYCAGDGSAGPCPQDPGCAAGAPGEGCVNSTGRGAWLRAVGSPAAQDVQFLADGLPAGTTALLVGGTQRENGGLGTPFGDGLSCVAQPASRLGAAIVDAAGLFVPASAPAAGGTLHYQVLYRNAAPFCTPGRFNLSNGYTIAWP